MAVGSGRGYTPYAFNIDWGDGTSSVISRKQAGPFSIRHIYDKAGGDNDTFAIKITGSDATDATTFLQLVIIIHDASKIAYAGPSEANFIPPLNISFRFIWPLYTVVLLMATSFWAGERREYVRLRAKASKQ